MGILCRVSKTYTRQEVDEILRRALASQAADGISHDDLVAAAREVGIPGAAVEAAALELGESRLVGERVAQLRRRLRGSFLRHALVYLVVNAGIFYVDRADGGAWFFQYPLIAWGVLLVLLAILQLAPDQRSLTRRAERELEKERRRAQRRQRATRVAGSPQQHGAREFENAVQEGVGALLSAAARAIRGLNPEAERYRVNETEPEPGSVRDGENAPARRSQRS